MVETFSVFILLVALSGASIDLKFLSAVQRFSCYSYTDIYFSCSLVGDRLQWEVNQMEVGEFQDQSERRFVWNASDFTCVASLLSRRPENGDQVTFDSILVVTVENSSKSLEVACSNEHSQKNVSSNGAEPHIQAISTTNKTSLVHLRHIFIGNIISNSTDLHTSVFICGVQTGNQHLMVGERSYGFGDEDNIGEDRQFPSSDTEILEQQAIFIAKQPYSITSILFVTKNSNEVNVECMGKNKTLMLSVEWPPTSTANPSTISTNTAKSRNGVETMDSTSTNIVKGKASSDKAIPTTIIIVLLIFFAAISF